MRYGVDRPEFLFGVDMNNNGWVDRFENDDLPDYPYKKDHWGYNAYARVQVNPDIQLNLGRLRQSMHKADRDSDTFYGMATYSKDWPVFGRWRVFDMVRIAQDTIEDDLVQWVIPKAQYGQAVVTPRDEMRQYQILLQRKMLGSIRFTLIGNMIVRAGGI